MIHLCLRQQALDERPYALVRLVAHQPLPDAPAAFFQRELPGYVDLVKQCREARVEVFPSVMSMTGAINVGEGALAVGFAAEPHEYS